MPEKSFSCFQSALLRRDSDTISQQLAQHPLAFPVPSPHIQIKIINPDVLVALAVLMRSGHAPYIQQALNLARVIVYDGMQRTLSPPRTRFANPSFLHSDCLDALMSLACDWLPSHTDKSVKLKEYQRIIDIFGALPIYAERARISQEKKDSLELEVSPLDVQKAGLHLRTVRPVAEGRASSQAVPA